MATFWTFVFAILIGVLSPCAHAAEVIKGAFDVPAGAADKSLKQFAQQSGLEVVFIPSATANIRTNAIKGFFTPREAIDAMLKGTNLVATQEAETGAMRIRRVSDPNG